MAGIQSSTGLVTGVKIQDTVDQLMALAAKPRDRLAAQVEQLKSQQVAVGQLTALVIGVQLSTDQLGRPSLYEQTKVSSSSSSLSAVASGTPTPGRYQFVPIQLAQQQQFTSSALASADQLVGAGKIEVHAGGFLDTTVALDELNGGAGVARGQIRITDRSGKSALIDLRFAHTAADVVQAINGNTDLRVTASLDGDRFTLSDTSGGAGSLTVNDVGTGTTARDLGLAGINVEANTATGSDVISISRSTSLRSLLDGRGVQFAPSGASLKFELRNGTNFEFTTALNSNSASVGQLIDAINSAGEGKVRASINAAGNGLKVEDLTTGSSTFQVTSPKGDLATDLGWTGTAVDGVIDGAQLQSGLGDVLLSSLGGGSGVGTLGELKLTDRTGAQATINLSSAKTIGDVIKTINNSVVGVRARLNDSRTGITLTDTSGGTTTSIAATSTDGSNTATKLGLGTTTDPARLDGKSLQRQWVTSNMLVADWDQGRGLPLGTIKVTNSANKESTINLSSSSPKTIGDVIKAINKSANGFEARINETGDGLMIVDTAGGSGDLKVEDVGTGTTAKQLHLAGTSKSLTVDGSTVKGIDGTLDYTVETTDTTTVAELVTKLNAADDTLKASVLTLGSGGVRLAISSAASGTRGRISFDTSSLAIGFSETLKAQDALLSVGGSASGGGVLISSSTNTFEGAAPGVKLTINEATRTAVSVDVTENPDAISKQIQSVVDQFNKLRDKMGELTKFDTSSFATGTLFGSGEVLRIDLAFSQLFSGISGSGAVRSMAELGVSYNDTGKLEFDKDKFSNALKRDPAAVKKFLSDTEKGFSVRAKAAADSLAGTKGGSLLQRSNTLQAKIELNSTRISSWAVRLDTQRTRLLTQFYNMETAIAKLQTNLNSISKIVDITKTTNS